MVVAFSGGLDSTVLLHLLAQDPTLKTRLQAVHINHQIHPDAAAWAAHCRAFCQTITVAYTQIDLQLPNTRRKGLEAIARKARYEALFAQLHAGDWLLTAHHQRDQAETLLLNLTRGAGVLGLAGMPYEKPVSLISGGSAMHGRPLLSVGYAHLQHYAADHSLAWVDDPSNASVKHTRNRIRHCILPELERIRERSTAQIALCAEHMGEAQNLLERMARQQLNETGHYSNVSIDLNAYQHLDWIAQKNLLRYWARHHAGLQLNAAELNWIQHYTQPATALQADYRLSQGCLKLFKGKLFYLTDKLEEFDFKLVDVWQYSALRETPHEPVFTQSLPQSWLEANRHCLRLCSMDSVAKAHRKHLKEYFQQAGVPAWLRPYWPVLMCNNELIAIWGLAYQPPSQIDKFEHASGHEFSRVSSDRPALIHLSLTESQILALCTHKTAG
nr:tRNA lysidine(34) synthetase TilS [Thiomicrorhabdus cannonii]